MPVDWGAVAQGVIGALGARENARQANQPRNTTTNQTTTQTPFGLPLIAPDIEAALDYQRQLMAQGPYTVSTGAGGGGGGSRAGVGTTASPSPTRRTGSPATWTNARGETMTLNAQGQAVRAPAGGVGGTTPSSPSSPTAPGSPPAINWSDPTSIAGAVAQRGLAAGNDPTTRAAQLATQNILAGQGGANSGGTGYQNYNPIADWLAQNQQGRVAGDDSTSLLRQFIGDVGPGDTSGYGAGAGSARGVARNYATSGPGGGVGVGSAGGGNVPDTVGGNSSYFATQLRQLMDSQRNDADLQAIIDAANADTNRGLASSLWGLDAQAQGTGRFGGDMWAGLGSDARRQAAAEMSTNASRTRLAEQEARRAMYQNLLGQVNTRDLGAMQDATQRYGIDSAAASSSAGSGAAAAAANRAQQLQAILALQQGGQFSAGLLGGLGQQLSGDQLNAIGAAPSLAGIGLSGLGAANQAAGTQADVLGIQNQLRAAQINAGVARSGQNLQASMFNAQQPQNLVNNYFDMLRGIGGMGGTSTTQGNNVVAGLGVSPTYAALLGGAAGYYGAGR